jgi:signal transduction histidine kinase
LFLAVGWLCWLAPQAHAQNTANGDNARTKRVLLVFSESRDLPGNMMMEQSVRAEMLKNSTNPVEFFAESMDAVRFPSARHYELFREYLKNKYAGLNLDLAIVFMARNFMLAEELPAVLGTNVPSVFVAVNDLNVPKTSSGRPFTGIVQRFDVQGTINFILQLQPETLRVAVIGGTSVADKAVLERIEETARPLTGVRFVYWTNQPLGDVYQAAAKQPKGTAILLGSVQRDASGEPVYTSQVARRLALVASVPVYVLGAGQIGTGALGGDVVDFDNLGARAGELGLRALAGTPVSQIPMEVQSNGVPMVDWQVLQRWQISSRRLPANCVLRNQPESLWSTHWELIVLVGIGFLAQAITIAALLVQRSRQHRAEAEILKQRAELAHVARVSVMGQLASALTHELNQPLGAILRNAEAAEILLQSGQPNLDEVRAILTDIRRDDKRAGNVIDGMRSLFKRQKLASGTLDMGNLVEDTVAMARPDAAARQVKLKVEIAAHLPPAQGDRVHVQQVLLNLILNGMDAMNTVPKSRRSLVVVLDETAHGNLQVRVIDCGGGIGPDAAEHIFEPFFTTKATGMGMGLAISRTIIEAHGGELWMNSNAMEGTTFTFILPPAGFDKVKPGDLPATP